MYLFQTTKIYFLLVDIFLVHELETHVVYKTPQFLIYWLFNNQRGFAPKNYHNTRAKSFSALSRLNQLKRVRIRQPLRLCKAAAPQYTNKKSRCVEERDGVACKGDLLHCIMQQGDLCFYSHFLWPLTF